MFEEVKEIILEQLDLDEKDIKEDSRIIEDLGADSLDLAELVSAIEQKIGRELKKEELESIRTVKDLENLLKWGFYG